MESSQRLYFMDNLRSIIIILVIFLHTSLCYMAYPPKWWYVIDPKNSIFFTYAVILTDVFIMPAMFFISGYFLFYSFRKKSFTKFAADKIWRIALPWVAGVFLFAPPLTYMIYFSRQIPVSFMNFLRNDFFGKAYQQAHYWFIGVLLAFVIIAVAAAFIIPKLTKKNNDNKKPGFLFHILLISLATCAFTITNQFYPLNAWIHPGFIFVFQPIRLFGLFMFFCLGIYAEKNSWFTEKGYTPNSYVWLITAFVSGTAYILFKIKCPQSRSAEILFQGINALLFNIFCYSSIIFAAAFTRSKLNFTNRFLKLFSNNSYGSYYVHQFFIFSFAYILTKTRLQVGIKFFITMTAAVIFSWTASFFMKKTPILKKIF